MKKFSSTLAVLFLILNINLLAQDSKEITQFKLKYNISRILIDNNEIPSFIEGELTPKNFKGTDIAKVYKFFEENKLLFKMNKPEDELRVYKNTTDELNMTHIRLNQYYKNIRVYGNELIAHLTPNGELKTINGSFLPLGNIKAISNISNTDAENAALSDIQYKAKNKRPNSIKSEQVFYQFNGQIFLAWVVNFLTDKPYGRWEYFINASNGSIIYKANRLMNEETSNDKKVKAGSDSLVIKPVSEVLTDNLVKRNPTGGKITEPQNFGTNNPQKTLGWTTIMSESFEGSYPTGLWSNLSSPTVNAFWDDQSYLKYSGSKSAWCAAGGTQALSPSGGQYLDNMNAWMVYGPFDLSDATDAELLFSLYNNSETDYDYFKCMASINYSNFYGLQWTGSTGGWTNINFDLTNVYTLGNLCGQPQVWIAFIFQSDVSFHVFPGAFVDDILLQKNNSASSDVYEPNNSFGTANTSAFPTLGNSSYTGSINAYISPSSDLDYFYLGMNGTGTLTITLSNLPADYDLQLFNSSQSEVAYSENGGTDDETITYSYLTQASTWFYIEVHGYQNASSSGIPYQLAIQWTPMTQCDQQDAIGTGLDVFGLAKTHIDTYGCSDHFFLLDRTRRASNNPHGHNGQMLNDQSIETRLYPSSSPMVDNNNIWDATTQGPGVDAQVYTAYTYDFMRTQLGRNSFDNNGAGMLSVVERDDDYNNAYWDGTQITFYVVSSGYRSMAGAIDIVSHEWGHAITQYESDLVYEKEPGALNESFSDMIGIAIGFNSGVDPDWQQGENFSLDGTPIRDMTNPHLQGQPDTYIDDIYWISVNNCTPARDNDYCGVHTNSGVPNKMFYLLSQGGTHNGRTVTGIGLTNAIKIMYRANTNYWTTNTNFLNAKQGCISAANDLDASGNWATQVRNAWEAVKVGVSSLTITCSANPSNGGTTSGCGTFNAGQTATVVAAPNSGWSFINWTENQSSVSTSASYSFTVSSNRNLVANFQQAIQYTINCSASPSTGGTTSGCGTFNSGQTATVVATSNQGWAFNNWTENGTPVSTQSSYSFTVTNNRTLIAHFTSTAPGVPLTLEGPSGVSNNQEFDLQVKIANVTDLKVISFDLIYPTQYIDYVSNTIGTFITSATGTVIPSENNGKVSAAVYSITGSGTGTGIIITLRFKATGNPANGTTFQFCFQNIQANNSNGDPINISPECKTIPLANSLTVWPGDANNDGAVNIIDINPVIIYFNSTGPVRTPGGIGWSGQTVSPWSPESKTYADCNGNGTIEITDINGVIVNFNKVHTTVKVIKERQVLANPPLMVSFSPGIPTGQEFWIDVSIGSPGLPVTSVNVLSFELKYTGTDYIDYVSNEIGSFLTGALPTVIPDDIHGKISASAFSLSQGYSGYGLAFRFKFKVLESVTTPHDIYLYWGLVSANRSDGSSQPLDTLGFTGGIVPVELTSFNALFNDNRVSINWSTATETNNRGFEIEKSFDNNEWKKISFVPGTGTSSEKHDYIYTDKPANSGMYNYRLKQIDYDGSYSYSEIISVEVNLIPDDFTLEQNYPNPFNPTTTISYSIPLESQVTLTVYDAIGNQLEELVNEEQAPGKYEIKFNAEKFSSGIYFYKLQAGTFTTIKKLLLMK